MLFHGLVIAVPTLLGLATELALKALHLREVCTAPKSHDLHELFDRLPPRTRRRLEHKIPGVPTDHPGLPAIFPAIRETLEANRCVFVEWRYMHERLWLRAETSALKQALRAIIDTFEESGLSRDAPSPDGCPT